MERAAVGRGERAPRVTLLLRLLAAIDEGRCDFEGLKRWIDEEKPPSTRSLRRYLAELSLAGFPWFYDHTSGTYRFEGGYSLRRLELSSEELLGLLTLKGIATSLGGDIGHSIGEVAEKLTRVAGRVKNAAAARPAVRVQLSDPQLNPERAALFATLQRAQRERQSVRFGYVDKRGKHSERHVDPYGFVVSGGRIYAVAYDRGRGAKRVFALDAISSVVLAPGRFTLPPDFDLEAFAAGSVSGIMHADESIVVTVRYSPVVAGAARAERVVRERTIEERPDGFVEIAYTVADAAEFVRWTMKWGAEAEVLAPPQARAHAAETAREILARYEPAPPPKR
jgi:proteasome accessory factor B